MKEITAGPVDESLRLIRLRTGALMPTLGMGTWHHGPKEEIQDALRYKIFVFVLNVFLRGALCMTF